LRWLLLTPELRGQGLGRRLVQESIDFARAAGYTSIFLWTVKELIPAGQLYRSLGFELTEEASHDAWGRAVTEQRFEMGL
jgi:GNAT superfamily N-acetyltransferase